MKRSTIILVLLALATMMSVAGLGEAGHCGTGGSPHDAHGSCETSGNQLKCGAGTATPAGQVYAGQNGVGLCNDGTTVPVKGRVGANTACQCIYADGSAGNTAPADGWLRIDQNGPTCSVDGQQSYNSGPGGGLQSCG